MSSAKTDTGSFFSTAASALVGGVLAFALFARGARDLWASTLVIFFILVLFVAALLRSARSSSPGFQFPFYRPLTAIMAAMTASLIFSTNPSESFLTFLDGATAILLFILCVNLFRVRRNIDILLMGAVPVFWIECGIVVWQIFHIPEPEKMGTLVNPNLLVAFVLPWILLFLERTARAVRSHHRMAWYWGSGLAAALATFVPAQSGGGWISLIIGGTALTLLPRAGRWPARLRKWVPWVMAGAGLIILFIFYDKFTRVYDPVLYPHREMSNRLYWWASALSMLRAHPLFGVGLGNFQHAYLSFKLGGTENSLFAHSFPLQMMAEAGLVGVLSCGYCLVAFLRYGRRQIGDPNRWPFVAAFLSMLLFASFNIALEYLVNLMMAAVLCAASVASDHHRAHPVRFSVALLVGALGLFALPYIASPFFASRYIVSAAAEESEGHLEAARHSYQQAINIWNLSWEPYAGLARIASKQEAYPSAVVFQVEALKRNRLSRPLKRDLETYSLLAGTLEDQR